MKRERTYRHYIIHIWDKENKMSAYLLLQLVIEYLANLDLNKSVFI